MKRYMVFAFDTYYPSGGIGDLRGSYATKQEAYTEFCIALDDGNKHAHIWDCATETIIKQS